MKPTVVQLLRGSVPAHPDSARPCHTPTEKARSSLSMIQAAMAEWQRHQRQRDAEWQHLTQAAAKAVQSPSLQL